MKSTEVYTKLIKGLFLFVSISIVLRWFATAFSFVAFLQRPTFLQYWFYSNLVIVAIVIILAVTYKSRLKDNQKNQEKPISNYQGIYAPLPPKGYEPQIQNSKTRKIIFGIYLIYTFIGALSMFLGRYLNETMGAIFQVFGFFVLLPALGMTFFILQDMRPYAKKISLWIYIVGLAVITFIIMIPLLLYIFSR